MMLRQLIAQIDLPSVVRGWHRYTQLPEDDLEDAALEVLLKLLAMASEDVALERKFASVDALLAYVRVAAVRRVLGKRPVESLEEGAYFDSSQSPEQALLAMVEMKGITALIESALAHLETTSASHIAIECRQIVRCILAQPEQYIRTRESGQEQGTLVFHYSKLAEHLPLKRTTIYDRLRSLRQALYALEHVDRASDGTLSNRSSPPTDRL